MSMDKKAILEILRAHQRSFRNGRCSCEKYERKRTFEQHDAHVAEVLAKHMHKTWWGVWDRAYSAGWNDEVRRDNPYADKESTNDS